MTCLSCEERAKLLKQARDAFHAGDHAAVERILTEVFGTIKMDVTKLAAAIFKTGGLAGMGVGARVGVRYSLRDIMAADENDRRPEDEKKEKPE